MSDSFWAGTGEKMQYLVHEFNDNTLRFALKYSGQLCPDTLCRAAGMLVERVDVLHASFHSGRLNATWRIHRDYEEDDYFRLVHVPGDPVQQALMLASEPVLPSGRTQLRCTLVQGNRESAVVFLISHLCVDGSDGHYLLVKLAEAYRLSKTQSADGFVIKNGNRAAEQVYEGLDRRKYRSLLKDPRTGVKSVFPYPTEDEGIPRAVWQTIEPGVMNRARSRARAAHATVNDLILSACYHAYAAVEGVDARAPMSIMSMMDLRLHCKDGESKGLSNLTGSLPTLLEEGVCSSFEKTLAHIACQTAKVKADPLAGLHGLPLLHGAARRLPMGLLVKIASRLYGSMAVGLTNLGIISCKELEMDGLRPDRGWFGGPLKKKPGTQISVASFDGECTLCIFGRYTQEDAEVLQRMLDNMAEIIRLYADEEGEKPDEKRK